MKPYLLLALGLAGCSRQGDPYTRGYVNAVDSVLASPPPRESPGVQAARMLDAYGIHYVLATEREGRVTSVLHVADSTFRPLTKERIR